MRQRWRRRRALATTMLTVAVMFGGITPQALELLQRMNRRAYAVQEADGTSDDGLVELLSRRWFARAASLW